jgi:DNA-binding GntR family transcriptional regulator
MARMTSASLRVRTRPHAAPAKRPAVSASTYVADRVRAEILTGGLRLGSRLDQQALAERHGVSLIPVREALRRLEADGLVRMLPRRGAFVAELSLRELTEISWIRERLEDLAVRLATPRLRAPQLRELARLNERMATMPPRASPSLWGRLNRRWHFTIYEAGQSVPLVQLITALWDRTSLYREVLAADVDTRATSVAQHAAVLRRLEAGDAAGAARAMRQHIRRGMRDMRATEVGLGTGK